MTDHIVWYYRKFIFIKIYLICGEYVKIYYATKIDIFLIMKFRLNGFPFCKFVHSFDVSGMQKNFLFHSHSKTLKDSISKIQKRLFELNRLIVYQILSWHKANKLLIIFSFFVCVIKLLSSFVTLFYLLFVLTLILEGS